MDSPHLDRRKKYSLDRIRYAAVTLLKEKDINNITVTDVCRIADLNRGTFYNYYQDIDDMFAHIGDSFVGEIRTLFVNAKPCFCMEDGSLFLKQALAVIEKHAELILTLHKTEMASQIINEILSFGLPAIKKQMYKKHPGSSETEVDYLAEYIIGGSAAIVMKWIHTGMEIPMWTIQEILLDRLTEALV